MTIELINQYGEKRTVYPLDRDIQIPHPFNLNDTLQHLEGQINCAIPYDPEIHKFLVENTFLKSKVYNEESQTIFTGVVKDGLEWIDNGTPEPLNEISLTLQDNGYYLNNTPEEDITYINQSLTTILADICKRCNLQIGSNLPTDTISVAQIKQNTTYLNFINDILFQHCYAFGFDENGVLQTINIKEMETSEVFDDFFTGLKFTKTTKNYNAIHLNYGELTVKQNEQVYYEGGEISSDNTIQPIIIQPNAYYPPEATPIIEEQDGKVIQNFSDGFAQAVTLFNGEKKYQRSKNTELIYTEDHVVTKDYSDNLTLDRTDFTATSASVRFYNNSATDAELYQLAIRATAYYRRPKKLILGEGKKFEYEAIYIYDSQRASTFANFLAKYFLGGNYKIAARTEKNFLPGTKLTLKTGISGIATRAIVISSTYNPREKNYNITFLTESDLALSPKFYQDRHTSQLPGPKGPKGDKGDSGIGIKSITEYYLATEASSGVTNATSGFTTSMQSLTSEKKYLWNYELITYTDLTTSKTNAVIIGVYGDKGQAGADGEKGDTGKGVKSITEYYLATANASGVTNETSGFTTAIQTVSSSKKYLWNYEKIIYTDNSETKTNAVIIGVYGDKGDTGSKGDTGKRGTLEFSGTEINFFDVSDVAYKITTASNGITSATMPIYIGDTYVHTVSQDVWVCVKEGSPTTALWRHQGRRVSDKDDSNLFRLFSVDSPYISSSGGSKNEIVEGTNPFGVKSKLIKISNKNGKIYSRSIPYEKKIPINSGKSYRAVAYIKKNDTIYNDYIGIRNSSDSTKNEISLLDGSVTDNGYYVYGAFGPLEDWYLVIGYVMASDKTEAPLDSGVYNCSSKKKIKSCKNFKWVQGCTSVFHYGTQLRFADVAHSGEETESVCYLYDMRFDEMNGTEPSLTELLYGQQHDTLTLESLEQGGGTIGQLGLYQGQLYKWNGTSWDLTEGVLPTDPVLHYSFDELPDIPDGIADYRAFNGETYKKCRSLFWVWMDKGNTITDVNGNIHVVAESIYCGIGIGSQHISGKVVKIKINVISGTTNLDRPNQFGLKQKFDTGVHYVSFYFPTNVTSSIGFTCDSGETAEFEIVEFYIGDGSYSTPLIDNAGKNNAKITAATSVITETGKGVRFFPAKIGYGIAKSPLINLSQISFSVWLKTYEATATQTIVQCRTVAGSGLSVFLFLEKIRFDFGGVQDTFNFSPSSNRNYHVVVVGTTDKKKLYIDGKLVQSISGDFSVTPNLAENIWFGSSSENGTSFYGNTLNGELDDFQIFDRALSDQEVLGLYLARGNTPKQYTRADYEIEHKPRYLGIATSSVPSNPSKDSWFTAAEDFSTYKKGHVYQWNGIEWVILDPLDSTKSEMFMTALNDILGTKASEDGYFSTIFAKALIANQAFIQSLQSQVITLTKAFDNEGQAIEGTGIIQSQDYIKSEGKQGWQIRADGKADFKHVTLDYIKSSYAELTDSKFSGELDCGNLQVQTIKNEVIEKTFDKYSSEEDMSKGRAKEFLTLFGYSGFKSGVDEFWNISTLFGDNRRVVFSNEDLTATLDGLIIKMYQSGSVYKDDYLEVIASTQVDGRHTVFKATVDRAFGSQNIRQTSYGTLEVIHNKGNEKKLIFTNLESSEPVEKNIVWADSNGYLRIKK